MKIADSDQITTPPDGRPPEKQPKWRQDFPIDWPQDEYVARRDLVKFMLLTSAAFVGGQFWIILQNLFSGAEAPSAEQAIATVAEVPVGGAKVFEYPEGSSSRLLVRLGEDTFAAYDQQCTHLMCPVLPQLEEGKLHCPCHEGWFDAQTGRPLAGPPRRPLPRITLDVRDGTIYATGVEEQTA